jgi:hypothetical protein
VESTSLESDEPRNLGNAPGDACVFGVWYTVWFTCPAHWGWVSLHELDWRLI